MTINHSLPILLACTLTFLLLVVQLPRAASQEISFTEEPKENYYIVKKKPVTITCAARHAVDISFTCGGVKVPPTSVDLDAFSEDDPEVVRASISVTRADVLSYRKKVEKYWCECSAIGIDGQVAATSQKGRISSAVLRYRFKKQPTEQSVIDGDSVVFECEPPVSDPKPEIFWKKDNRRINMDAEDRFVLSDTGSLLIDSVVGSDAGAYSCVARSPAGRRESKRAMLQITVLAAASESETEYSREHSSGAKSREERETDQPFFSTEPKSVYYVKQNEEVSIDCHVTSAGIITFRCNGARTSRTRMSSSQGQDNDGNRIIQSKLQVLYSHVQDFMRENGNDADYRCQCVGWYQVQDGGRKAWKSILSSKNSGLVKLAFLETEFKKEPTDAVAGVNTKITLKCEPPKGQPSPWVFWYKDDVKIDPRLNNNYRMSRQGNLVIVSAQYSDEGRYKCVAENIVKEVESGSAQLRIAATPPPPTTPTTTTGLVVPKDVKEGVMFLQDLAELTEINKQGVAKMTCITLGANTLSIDCDGRRLPEGEAIFSRETHERTGKMIITVTTEVGAGDVRTKPDGYACQCTAWELVNGTWSRHAGTKGFVVEKTKTYIDEEFAYAPKDAETEVGSQVEIPCEPPAGNPMPKVYWLKDGSIVSPESDSNFQVLQAGTLVVESARANDQGEYICVAENEAGTRRSKPIKLTVMQADPAKACDFKMCQEILVQSVSSQDETVVCEAVSKAKKCIMDLKCPPEMNAQMDGILNQLLKTEEACDTSAEDCNPTKCQQIMTDATSSADQEVMCDAMAKAKKCLMDLECSADMQTHVDTAIGHINQNSAVCGDCNPLKCQGALTKATQSGDSQEICSAIVETKECMMNLKCPDDVQPQIDMALEQIEQSAAICGSSSSDCIPKMAECQAQFTEAQSRGGIAGMCNALADVRKCLEDLQCPSEMQSSVDRALQAVRQSEPLCKNVGPTTPSGIGSTGDSMYSSATSDYDSTTYDFFGDTTFSGLLEPFFTAEPEPQNYIMTSNGSVTLSCTIIAAKTLVFACNGQVLKDSATTGYVTQEESGHTIRENTLSVTAQQVEAYQGSEPYSCLCRGFAKREDKDDWFNVDSRIAVIQRAFLERNFVQEPMSKEAMVGETVILTCIPPNGVPKPTVSWVHDEYRVSESDDVMIKDDGSLVIENFSEGDEGEYTCSAGNMLGQRTSQSVQLSIKTSGNMMSTSMPDMTSEGEPGPEPTPTSSNYNGEPFISKDLHSVYYVTKNKPAQIVCEATAVNDISFDCLGDVQSTVSEAYVQDVQLADGSMVTVNVVTAIATVSKANLEGSGDFYCTCKGHYLNNGAQAYIESQQAFVELAYLKKKFVREPENFLAKEGDFLTISCLPPAGNPQPKISWMKNRKPLESSGYPSGTLAIESLTVEDGGEYVCVAENLANRRMTAPFLIEVLPRTGMTTPDDVMGGGDGDTTTDDTGIEVVEITSGVPLTSDSTDEQSTMFNGWTTTESMTSDPVQEDTTMYYKMSTSTTEEMESEKSTMPRYTTGDMMGKGKDTTWGMHGSDDSTHTDFEDSTAMPMHHTSDDMYMGETKTPEPSYSTDSSMYEDSTPEMKKDGVTMENVYDTCHNVLEGCQQYKPSFDNIDVERACMGDDSYPKCMENYIKGCRNVADEDVLAMARKDYAMAKQMCDQLNSCPQLQRCRFVYSESQMDNPMDDLDLEYFCEDRTAFMECVNNALAECGVGAAYGNSQAMSSSDQVGDWFQAYCQKFVLQDTLLDSCTEETSCALPIGLSAKDNSTYWCRMVNTLHMCTSNSVSVCQLSELGEDIEAMKQMINDMGCEIPMVKEGEEEMTTSMEKEEKAASTQRTIESCDGDDCGATSIGVSILLISLLQFALAFFMTEQR